MGMSVYMFLGFLLFVFAPPEVCAGPCGSAPTPFPPAGMMGPVADGYSLIPMGRHIMDLGLDDKQREAIREIMSRVEKEKIRKEAELQVARIELKELLDREPIDMNGVETKLKSVESMVTAIHLSHIRAAEEVKARLTRKQRRRLKSSIEMGPPHRGMRLREMELPPTPCDDEPDVVPPRPQYQSFAPNR
jgi:Spy/CpxP family protein refolding chaperone